MLDLGLEGVEAREGCCELGFGGVVGVGVEGSVLGGWLWRVFGC